MAKDRDQGHIFYPQTDSDKTCTAMELAMGGGSAPSAAATADSTAKYEDMINRAMPSERENGDLITQTTRNA